MEIARPFKSRRLAEVLFILLLVIMVIGVFLPQKGGFSPERYQSLKAQQPALVRVLKVLGLVNVFSSWLFFTILSLFFINALFCTWSRLQWALRQLKREKEVSKSFIQRLKVKAQISWAKSSSKPLDAVAEALSSKRFRISRAKNSISAWKNRWAVFASPLFHLALLIILLSVVFGRATRLEGATRLVEGNAFTEAPREYLHLSTGPLFAQEHQEFQVRLNEVYFDYEKDGLKKGTASRLTALEDGAPVKEGVAFANHPVVYKGFSFYQGDYGLAPFLRIMDEQEKVISEGYLVMKYEEDNTYAISTDLEDTDYSVKARLYPDAARDGGHLRSKSELPKNPLLVLTLYQAGNEVLHAFLSPNELVSHSGLLVDFDHLRKWSELAITKDASIPFLYAGFGIGIFFLAVIFLVVPRYIWAYVEEREGIVKVYIGGRALKYHSSFEREMEQIVESVRNSVR